MRTLREIIWSVCDEVGLPRPPAVTTSSDITARQMLAFANREGFELSQKSSGLGSWQQLRKENIFQTNSTGVIPNCTITEGSNIVTIGTPPDQTPVAGWVMSASGGSNATGFQYPAYIVSVVGSTITMSATSTISSTDTSIAFGQESYPLPADYNYMINQTQWDRGYRWQIMGPLNAQEWQVLKSGLSPTGPRRRFRIMENEFYIDPIPFDNSTLVFEYYSTAFCYSSAGVAQTAWTADTDTPAINDELFILGIKWRFLRAKGFDYAEEYKNYSDMITSLLGRNMGAKILPLAAQSRGQVLINNSQVPDTGFGQ